MRRTGRTYDLARYPIPIPGYGCRQHSSFLKSLQCWLHTEQEAHLPSQIMILSHTLVRLHLNRRVQKLLGLLNMRLRCMSSILCSLISLDMVVGSLHRNRAMSLKDTFSLRHDSIYCLSLSVRCLLLPGIIFDIVTSFLTIPATGIG